MVMRALPSTTLLPTGYVYVVSTSLNLTPVHSLASIGVVCTRSLDSPCLRLMYNRPLTPVNGPRVYTLGWISRSIAPGRHYSRIGSWTIEGVRALGRAPPM